MIETSSKTASLNADSGRRISLRIGVDEQNAMSPTGDDRGEIDRGRGLPDSAFLVRDGYRLSHWHVALNLTHSAQTGHRRDVSRVPVQANGDT